MIIAGTACIASRGKTRLMPTIELELSVQCQRQDTFRMLKKAVQQGRRK